MEKTITISKKLYDEIKDTLYHCEETMEELEQYTEYRFGDTLGHVRDTLSSMDLYGYFACSIGQVSKDIIEKYKKNIVGVS